MKKEIYMTFLKYGPTPSKIVGAGPNLQYYNN